MFKIFDILFYGSNFKMMSNKNLKWAVRNLHIINIHNYIRINYVNYRLCPSLIKKIK